jgi:hypothetical protein
MESVTDNILIRLFSKLRTCFCLVQFFSLWEEYTLRVCVNKMVIRMFGPTWERCVWGGGGELKLEKITLVAWTLSNLVPSWWKLKNFDTKIWAGAGLNMSALDQYVTALPVSCSVLHMNIFHTLCGVFWHNVECTVSHLPAIWSLGNYIWSLLLLKPDNKIVASMLYVKMAEKNGFNKSWL